MPDKQWVPLEHQVGPAPYRPPRGGADSRRGDRRGDNRARMPRDSGAPIPQNVTPTDNAATSDTHMVCNCFASPFSYLEGTWTRKKGSS